VALAAIKSEKALAELAQLHDVHTTQIATWKAQLLLRHYNGTKAGRTTPDVTSGNTTRSFLPIESSFASAGTIMQP
jgi:hypothetical protein